jgi:hypothetical protein
MSSLSVIEAIAALLIMGLCITAGFLTLFAGKDR